MINLDGLIMNVVETDHNGVVDEKTIFHFQQAGDRVYAQYSGGAIDQGYLVGTNEGKSFYFRYCQVEADGTLNGGASSCELRIGQNDRVQLVENFVWANRSGGGRNVFQEILASEIPGKKEL